MIFHVRASMKKPKDFFKLAKSVTAVTAVTFILFG
jgi:hypothetical protein